MNFENTFKVGCVYMWQHFIFRKHSLIKKGQKFQKKL